MKVILEFTIGCDHHRNAVRHKFAIQKELYMKIQKTEGFMLADMLLFGQAEVLKPSYLKQFTNMQ